MSVPDREVDGNVVFTGEMSSDDIYNTICLFNPPSLRGKTRSEFLCIESSKPLQGRFSQTIFP